MTNSEILATRLVLALLWLASGALSLGLYPVDDSLALLDGLGLSAPLPLALLYSAAALDVLMGLLTLWLPRRNLWLAQALLIIAYTLLASLLVPEYWLHPFAPLLKNSAVLMLLYLLYRHAGNPGRSGT